MEVRNGTQAKSFTSNIRTPPGHSPGPAHPVVCSGFPRWGSSPIANYGPCHSGDPPIPHAGQLVGERDKWACLLLRDTVSFDQWSARETGAESRRLDHEFLIGHCTVEKMRSQTDVYATLAPDPCYYTVSLYNAEFYLFWACAGGLVPPQQGEALRKAIRLQP
ncbi:hypothetical protein RRG08_000078 [Elysia crispata]|uniref:Uncharacterized protein n=1 Tax=Elysia crispata TaxID=231223 RepID=A0AAE1A3J4_9GAST|nr:hypothetical protein RRG08_000078 [Elysia crispata]